MMNVKEIVLWIGQIVQVDVIVQEIHHIVIKIVKSNIYIYINRIVHSCLDECPKIMCIDECRIILE